jgi:hypothetical protein
MEGFTVDVEQRIVTHTSGASASFYRYETDDDWRRTDVVTLHNPVLFPGSQREFARLAKEAALAAGMTHGGAK